MKLIARYLIAAFVLVRVALFLQSCVPVDDSIVPQLEANTDPKELYYYQDTVAFAFTFRDNAGLDSGVVTITKIEPVSGANNWEYKQEFNLSGRTKRLEFKNAVVPDFTAEGLYKIRILVYDIQGNETEKVYNTTITKEIQSPVFSDLKLNAGTYIQSGNIYKLCRAQPLPISGTLFDNTRVTQIGIQLGSFTANVRKVSIPKGSSLDLRTYFGNSIVIPNSITDGFTELKMFAVDTFGNRTDVVFNLLVDCDQQPPQISILQTSPQVNATFAANIVQNATFTIGRATISDNRFVKEFSYRFAKLGAANAIVQQTVTVNSAGVINMQDFANLSFSIPANAVIGDVYELSIVARDSSFNTSLPTTIKLSVVEDVAPRITVTNHTIDGANTNFSTLVAAPVNIARSSVVGFEAKGEDDLRITAAEVFFQDIASSVAIPVINIPNFAEGATLYFGDYYQAALFTVPAAATVGATYMLRFSVKDSKGQISTLNYYFKVAP